MLPFLMLTAIMMGMTPDSLSLARGMSLGFSDNNNFYLFLGIGMHLITSVIAGMIFGFMIRKVNKFKIANFKRGIGEGISWAIIIFIVLYIPTTISMIQPNLVKIIHQINPNQNGLQNQPMVEKQILLLYGFGFIAHVVFGAALGYLMSFFVLRGIDKKNKK
jgi:hypothetical protein